MSGAQTGRRAPAPPADTLVAVLERRGRFLTAEALFPPRGPARQARGARISLGSAGSVVGGARPGDLVLVRRARRGAGARVLRVIGRPDVARDLIEALLLDRGAALGFDEELERQARAAAGRVGHEHVPRQDLRDLVTFTIDPVSARDFDDAISAEVRDDGTTRVWVHIADVAAHVPEGSPIDREARRRATSVYVPGAVEPMLPHALSSEACSLAPGVERAAVTVELTLRGERVLACAFHRSLIRSDARLDYEQVDRIFAGAESVAAELRAPLQAAREAAAALERGRERAGALVIDSEEPEFAFDAEGDLAEVRAHAHTEARRLIEHLMIAANEAVAELLSRRGVPCLYRVHERPEPAAVERLVEQLASLEVPTPPLPEPMSPSQAAELLGAASQRIDAHVRRTGRGRIALSALVLRSLKQAYYSPRNIGHAGLHSTCYCHFTSPIRRYPDIVCHRALLSALGAGEHAPAAQELAELGAWTSERERDAMETERDGDDIARCFALERVLYEEGPDRVFDGEVAGLIGAGAFVAFAAGADGGGAAPPFEGMLPVRRLASPRAGEREWWELNELGTIMRGERTGAALRLGDPLAVRVERVDPVRGRVDLAPAG